MTRYWRGLTWRARLRNLATDYLITAVVVFWISLMIPRDPWVPLVPWLLMKAVFVVFWPLLLWGLLEQLAHHLGLL